jgi:hypothetical protein
MVDSMALITATEALTANSNAILAGGASVQIIGANTERNGLRVSLDSAATAPLYLLLGGGTASATNFHVCVKAGGPDWDGTISNGVLWRGAVQAFSGAAGHFGVSET